MEEMFWESRLSTVERVRQDLRQALQGLPKHPRGPLAYWRKKVEEFLEKVESYRLALLAGRKLLERAQETDFLFGLESLAEELRRLEADTSPWQELMHAMVRDLRQGLWRTWEGWLRKESASPRQRVEAGLGAWILRLEAEARLWPLLRRGFQDWYRVLAQDTTQALEEVFWPPFSESEPFDQVAERTQNQKQHLEDLLEQWALLQHRLERLAEREAGPQAQQNLTPAGVSVPEKEIERYKHDLRVSIEALQRLLTYARHTYSRAKGRLLGRGESVPVALDEGLRRFDGHPLWLALEREVILWQRRREADEQAYARVHWWLALLRRYAQVFHQIQNQATPPTWETFLHPPSLQDYWRRALYQHAQEFFHTASVTFQEPLLPWGQRWLSQPEQRRRWWETFQEDVKQWAIQEGPTGKLPLHSLYFEVYNWKSHQSSPPSPLWEKGEWLSPWNEMPTTGGERLLQEIERALREVWKVSCRLGITLAVWGTVETPEEDACPPPIPSSELSASYLRWQQLPPFAYAKREHLAHQIRAAFEESRHRLAALEKEYPSWGSVPLAHALARWALEGYRQGLEQAVKYWEQQLQQAHEEGLRAERARTRLRQVLEEYYDRTRGWWGRRRANKEASRLHLADVIQEARRYWEGSPWWEDVVAANRDLFERMGGV